MMSTLRQATRHTFWLFFVLISLAGTAQFDTEFWFPPIWDTGQSGHNQPSELFITTPIPAEVPVHIRTADGTTLVIDTVVSSGNPLRIPLTPSLGQTTVPNTVLTASGLLVTSEAAIQCVHKISGQFNQTLVTMKGRNGLGTDFWAGSQVHVMNANYSPNEYHFISVMATEDNTTITMATPFNMFATGGGTLPNPYTITLNANESYLIRGNNPIQHVAGAHVTSDKNIVVTSGSTHTRILAGNAADGGTDQLVPVELMGDEFIVVKGDNAGVFDYAIIVATENSTNVYVDGSATPAATLNAGQYYDYTLTGSMGAPHYLRTDKTSYCYHFTGASQDDEVGMSAIPQIDCTGSRYIEFSLFEVNTINQIMNLIVPEFAEPTLQVNGVYYQDIPTAIWNTVPGKPDWTTISLPQSALQSDNIITSEGFFHAGFLTGNGGATGTYGFLSGFNDAFEFRDPEFNLPTTVYSIGSLCQGEQMDHCLLIYSCSDDHNIIDFEGNEGGIIVTPPSQPYDTCFRYTAPLDFVGNDTINFTVENRFGFQGNISVVVTVLDPDTPINAGPVQELCSVTTGTLSAVDPDPLVSGTWVRLSGSGTIVSPNSPTTAVTGLGFGVNTFMWSQDYGCQVNSSLTQIIVYDGTAPAAAAGPDAFLCSDDNTYTMLANDPGVSGTGTWEINQGQAIIFNINDNNAFTANLGIGQNIFEWNIDNGPCPGGSTADIMNIWVYDVNHPAANAGVDQEYCSDHFTEAIVAGTSPIFPATGVWTLVSGSGTITSPNSASTTITGCGIGVNTFAWTINNGPCGVLSDTIDIIIYDAGVVAANAGSDASYCSPTTTHTMTATEPNGPGSGTWTLISGTGVILNANNAATTISNLGLGDNVFRWTIDNGPCDATGAFDDVTITIFDASTPAANAGTDKQFCVTGLNTVILEATAVDFPAQGTWSVVAGTGVFNDANDPSTTATGLSIGANTFMWTVDNGPCAAPTSDLVTVTIYNDDPSPAYAGEDVSFCTPQSTYTMQATAAVAPSVGSWSLISGTGTISNINNPNANISGLGIGANTYRWTILNGPCPGEPNFDEITIFIYDENAPNADAGADQEFCSNPAGVVVATMDANDFIYPGSGIWTLVSGSGTIVDPTIPNTQIISPGIGENIFEWSINNGPCSNAASTDQVSIFVYDITQETANAGVDQAICSDNPTTTLDGNSLVFPASGQWVLTSGSGTVTNPNDPNTSVTGLGVGPNVFTWTIDNGPCANAISTDQVTITVFEGAMSPATAGPDQSICSSTTTVSLAGNVPVLPATGAWSVVSGSATFTNAAAANTTVTGLSVGINTLQWTVDNGACSGSTSDQVNIIVFDTNMPAANAGLNQQLCLPQTSTTMAATAPIFPATGTWTLVSGSGTIDNPFSPNTTISGLAVGENIFRWSVTNAPCSPANTVDLVSIFVFDSAQTVNAGTDQSFCSPVSSATMTANNAIFPAVGTWTLVSGSGNIQNPNNPTSLITGLGIGDNIFQWSINNGPCGGSPLTDTVTITIFNTNQAAANAGADQQVCTPLTSTTLAGNNAVYPATGMWTIVSGSATIVDPTSPTTIIENLTVGTVVLQWTITNGPCSPTSTFDTVTINVLDSGASPADAGPDQSLCLPISNTVMAANSAVSPAIGTWTLISGAGNIISPNNPTTTINGLAVGVNVFRWSINNGSCGGVSTDDVVITVYSNNSPNANAGVDQNLCTPQLSTTMAANSPIFPATGVWTLVSGQGDIVNPNSATSSVINLAVGENIFQWTLSNGPCGNSLSSDLVSIFVFDGGAAQANAGVNQILCTPSADTFMAADPAEDPGTGLWTLISGTGNIIDPTSPTTAIEGLSIGENVFQWTLDYSTCGVQQDIVSIVVYDSSSLPANAGADQELCSPTETTLLDAQGVNTPAIGTWTLISGSGQIADANNPNTEVTNLTIGENIFVWTVYNGECLAVEDRTDTVSVFVFNELQPAADAGLDQELCTPNQSTSLEGNNAIFPAIGTWTLVSGAGDIADPNNPTTTVSNLAVGENIFQWTIDNGACLGAVTNSTVSIFVFDENQAIADAGEDQSYCTPLSSINLEGNALTYPASGTWTLMSGTATIANPNDPNTGVSALGVGENIFRWTVSNGPCGETTSDYVSIFVYSNLAVVADAGNDQELCSPTSTTAMTGNTPTAPAIGTWILISGAGDIVDANNPTTTINNLGVGENIFVWSIDNGVCANANSTDTVSVFVFDLDAPLANAGSDQQLCTPVNAAQLEGNAMPNPAVGTWTVISGTGNFENSNDPNTMVFGLSVGENIFAWTVYNGPCDQSGSSDMVSVFLFDRDQPDADAGPDQQLCTPQEATNLAANEAVFPASGFWTLIEGSATIVDVTNPTTAVTDLEIGDNVFVWTILNGPCLNNITTDTVTVSLFAFDAQDAFAGLDQEFCLPTSETILQGNVPNGAQQGTWTVVAGTGVFADENDFNTAVTGLSQGVNTFAWTINNGPCGLSTDEVSVLIFNNDAPEAYAGEDQFWCTPISTTVLAADAPETPGTGTWTLQSGMGTIANPNNPNTNLSGLTIGENIFCWTVYNGPCEEPTTDCVSIFIYDENHPEADAGDDIEVCLPISTVVLGGTPAIFPAFGTWQLLSGQGTIAEVNNPNSIVSGLALGENTFVWTINNSPCVAGNSSDTVSVFVFEEGINAAFAGSDQSFCSPTDLTILSAAPLAAPNTGTWEVVSGNAVIVDPFNNTTEVNSLTVGQHDFVWTVYNGPCTMALSTDTVSVFIYDETQPPANGGLNQELCLPTTTTILQGNPPIFPATGMWTLVSGQGIIVTPDNFETQVTDLGQGVNIFSWTITNGPCANAETSAIVQVAVFDDAGVVADAGEDIEVCTPVNAVTLNAATPPSPATGTWTIVSGTGSLSDINDPNATYSGLTVGEHILQWTIYNGPCEENNDFDNVTISVFDATSPAVFAGDDQELCAPESETTLTATAPIFPATGTWQIVSGSGSIAEVHNPNATITGLQIGETVLSWMVQNGPCGETSVDIVSITIFNPASPNAVVGEDQAFCSPFPGATLTGNQPLAPATGEWTLVSGAGEITNAALPNTTVFNLGYGENIFVWTVYNGACANSTTSDTLSIFLNDSDVSDANAGPDIDLCGSPLELQMQGSETIGNTAVGTWSIVQGGGVFENPFNEFTYMTDIPVGENIYLWTVDNGDCGVSSDEVVVTVYDPQIPSAFAGENLEICEDDFLIFNLQGSQAPFPASGMWEIIEGPVEISDPLDPNATVWSLGELESPLEPVTSSLIWTVTNGPCGASADTVSFALIDCLTIEIPDGFSPNSDGINDFFEIPNLYKYPNNNIKIFNRWGALIYEAAPYQNDWDGRSYHPATIGEELPVSTYYYILDLGDGVLAPFTGYIFLKR